LVPIKKTAYKSYYIFDIFENVKKYRMFSVLGRFSIRGYAFLQSKMDCGMSKGGMGVFLFLRVTHKTGGHEAEN